MAKAVKKAVLASRGSRKKKRFKDIVSMAFSHCYLNGLLIRAILSVIIKVFYFIHMDTNVSFSLYWHGLHDIPLL